MRYSPFLSLEDVSTAEDIGSILRLAVEKIKAAKFRRYSRVCRRTPTPKNPLLKIPEEEVVDFRRIVCRPKIETIPKSQARPAPSKTKAPTDLVPASPKEEVKQRRASGFWKLFKLKPGSDAKRKAYVNHHVDATSMLSFV